MALVETAGAAFATSGTNTVTSGSYSPTAGTLQVAIVGVGNGNGFTGTSVAITDTSGSGTWTTLKSATGTGGCAGVFIRAAWSGAATVTATVLGTSVIDICLITRQFAGAAAVASQTGVTASVVSTSNQNLSITPGTTGSQVVGGFGTASAAKVLTANAATTIYGQFDGGPGGDTEACIKATSTSTSGTPIALGFTNTAASNTFALAEILPSGGASTSINAAQSVTATGTAAGTSAKPIAAAKTITATRTAAGTSAKPIAAAKTITATATATLTLGGIKTIAATQTITATRTAAGTSAKPVAAAQTVTATRTASMTVTGAADTINAAQTVTATANATLTVTNVTANLIVSIAARAGTDDYGNPFPEGFGLSVGEIPGTLLNAASVPASAVNFVARAIGGIITTVAATAPSGAIQGDLWIDTASGNAIFQYSGSAWILYQFGSGSIAANSISAAQIVANTITATQLAAGIIYATIVDGTIITGAQFVATGTSGEILVYSGTPASGNLVGSWSYATGTDGSGNAFPAGLSVGDSTMPQIQLLPNAGGGASAAAIQMPSNAGDQAVVPAIYGGSLNAGAANQQPYMTIQGPANSNDASTVSFIEQLTAASDDGTILPLFTITDSFGNNYLTLLPSASNGPQLGLGTIFDGDTPLGTNPIAGFLEGSLVSYGVSGGGTVVETITATEAWVCPAGVSTLTSVELWGPSAGAGGGSAPTTSGNGGAASGGGGYTIATGVASTPLKSYTATVGTGGAAGLAGTPTGAPGGNGGAASGATTFNADSGTLSAGAGTFGTGGHNGHTPGTGGTGTHAGGNGGNSPTSGTTTGGGGGGGAGGPLGAGTAGSDATGRAPAAGGASGGSPSGTGASGGWGSNSNNGNAGANGVAPGGGAGGGGGGTDAHTYTGGKGARGQIRITYTLPGTTGILASMASGRGAGTDPSGNTYPAGFQGQIVAVHPGSSPSTPEGWQTITPPTGWTGNCRYKLLAEENLVFFDISCTFTARGSKGNVTIVASSFPYAPAHSATLQLTETNNTAFATPTPALFVSSAGAVTAFNLDVGTSGVDVHAIYSLT